MARRSRSAVNRLLDRVRSRSQPPGTRQHRIPDGERVYAIGDVHGHLNLLLELLEKIKADTLSRTTARTTIILLGDLIDRGPHSSEVVELASTWAEQWSDLRAIQGNHEAIFLALMAGESTSLNSWLHLGGAVTLQSYGVSADAIRSTPIGDLLEECRSKVPSHHLSWLRELPVSWSCGDYLFVHAGVRPGVTIEAQHQRDFLTIRSEFLESEQDHGVKVVHGHSVALDPQVRHNRIGIDTGAYQTGTLSAIGLEGPNTWFLQSQLT